MKKTLLFAGLAIALASCTNEADLFEPNAESQIAFKAVAQNQTRGAFEGNYLPSATHIYVGAFQKTDAQYELYLKNADFKVFDDTEQVDNQVWVGDYNYPPTGTLDFLAYTCDYGNDQKKPDADWTSYTKTEWTADPTKKHMKAMTLSFNGENSLNGQTDVTYSDYLETSRNNSGSFNTATMTLNHAQAWIVVNFSKGIATFDDDVIKIRHVKVNGVHLNGDLTVTVNDDKTVTAEWTATDTADAVEFLTYADAGDDGITFGVAANPETDKKGLLVLPCAEQAITFEYCTKIGMEKDPTDSSKEIPVYSSWITYTTDPTDTGLSGHEWKAGNKYVYDFTMQSNKITFKVVVDGFDQTTVSQPIN